ncbi:hypothetical protein [Aminobacter sp. MSH1]|nr:hypothetical protein [Aminobacter sp. MSH1]
MTEKRRQHIFSENCTGHNVAPCCICERLIHRHNDRWIVEHKRALALLGADTNTNCGPAHYECAQVKTHTEDLPRIRKAKRQQEAATPRYVHDTHTLEDMAPPRPKKRQLTTPEGSSYDWKLRRYVKADPHVENR